MKKDLTVVVAAYNMVRYIEKCLHSVCCQVPADGCVKVLVVDDGSTDETNQLARAVLAQYPAVASEVVQQRNGGLSGARNTGLDRLQTEYVTFLDADDYWLPRYWEAVDCQLTRHQPDVLEYDAMLVDDSEDELGTLSVCRGESAYGPMTAVRRLAFASGYKNFAWARVYRSSLFRHLRFPVGRRYEDAAITPQVYAHATSIAGIRESLVAYRQRAGSITRDPQISDVCDILASGDEACSFAEGEQREYWAKVCARHFIFGCHVSMRLSVKDRMQARRLLSAFGKRAPLRACDTKDKIKLAVPALYLLYLSIRARKEGGGGLPINREQTAGGR